MLHYNTCLADGRSKFHSGQLLFPQPCKLPEDFKTCQAADMAHKVDATRNQHPYIIDYISAKSGKMSDFKIFQNFGTVF